MSAKVRLHSVQALRGISATLVVAAHALTYGDIDSPPVVFIARFSVEIFFVISGIVITITAGSGRFDAYDFCRRRVLRIVPLYWLVTMLVAAVSIIFPQLLKTTVFDLGYIVRSLLFIPAALPGTDDWQPLLKVGWTLNYEVFFYLVFGLSFWCRTSWQRSAIIIFVLSALAALSFYSQDHNSVLSFYASLNVLPFIAGLIIGTFFLADRPIAVRDPLILPLIAATVVMISIGALFSRDSLVDWPGHFFLTTGAVLVVVTGLSFERSRFARNNFLMWLGEISYSVYLLHMFVIGAVWILIRKAGIEVGFLPGFIAAWICMIVLSLMASWTSNRFFERPLIRLGTSVGNRSGRMPGPSSHQDASDSGDDAAMDNQSVPPRAF